jgi:hypothetical protein
MTTVARWKDALVRIANGESDPVGIAQEALRSRKPPPSTKPKFAPYERERIKTEARRKEAVKVFEDWWEQDCPSQRKYAAQAGLGKAKLHSLLYIGARIIAHPRGEDHRLHHEVRKFLGWEE